MNRFDIIVVKQPGGSSDYGLRPGRLRSIVTGVGVAVLMIALAVAGLLLGYLIAGLLFAAILVAIAIAVIRRATSYALRGRSMQARSSFTADRGSVNSLDALLRERRERR